MQSCSVITTSHRDVLVVVGGNMTMMDTVSSVLSSGTILTLHYYYFRDTIGNLYFNLVGPFADTSTHRR